VMDASALIGRSGRVKLKQEKQEGYAPKNVVDRYIDADKAPAVAFRAAPSRAPVLAGGDLDDDMPF
jgi:hypothetical protein